MVARELRHAHLRHELVRPGRGLEHAAEEVPRGHSAHAVTTRNVDLRVECEHDGNIPVQPGQVLEKLEAVARHAALA